jgi:hypothetical protein
MVVLPKFIFCTFGDAIQFGHSSIGMVIQLRVSDTRRIFDPMGTGTGIIFYPQVALVPDLNRDGYGTCIFFHPWVIRRVPDTLLPL